MKIEFIDNTPYSPQYRDVYFSREDGLAEARHVFLAGNCLPERWAGCSSFTIAEIGFGTGLNFLATWQCWSRYAPAGARLHFVSVEKHPL
ncbi:MAG: bifunctional tRNA (5-methylaminomethyl-2-thiouridine)(34)-methyltransferase MnmD/FAD-dependent 5-carboxymethylaminomethyl-2-thiouridine(34) oxidoreductase MnmC, partial [Gammaproteobacteria bacterium]|nr:bifunctional tRNA (5-methylaminomethyl-2-thiouridine)(34)-methyltransferase MnmD/FAD-dependent 5-carboxymethylaminomethyl-2-thiouridine(34) oxidoreductase MnmC [Gammaproteobacteria bacterium]